MPEHRSTNGVVSSLDERAPAAVQHSAQLSATDLWHAAWRPKRRSLQGSYYGETQERAARLFAEEAARLQPLGYRPISLRWSLERKSGWRARWHRKDSPGFLVVAYLASEEPRGSAR